MQKLKNSNCKPFFPQVEGVWVRAREPDLPDRAGRADGDSVGREHGDQAAARQGQLLDPGQHHRQQRGHGEDEDTGDTSI